jgi:hypothetical protein
MKKEDKSMLTKVITVSVHIMPHCQKVLIIANEKPTKCINDIYFLNL